MTFRLIDRFASAFSGKPYRHRDSSVGDAIAVQLYEDLLSLDRSPRFKERVVAGTAVVSRKNTRRGVSARRGDGSLGELIPGARSIPVPGFTVRSGEIATVEIGVEVKILAKAMIKQIDRVITVLENQVSHFRRGGGNAICVAIVGVNWSGQYTSYEGSRSFPTDGMKYLHPIQEAAKAEARLEARVRSAFDEFLILRFEATNEPPYTFQWVNPNSADLDYGAALTRIAREYERRFA